MTRKNHSSLLLSKEWLVKIDNANSVPYLFKFGVSEESSTCYILITDTKTAWAEVLTTKQILRRWRECNPTIPTSTSDGAVSQLQKLLELVHTPGGISDADFEIVSSHDADLAFELDCDAFKWRWDTYLLGPKTSAELVSRHLILPLISLVHVSFYSADPVSELEEEDLEKTVDRIGRAARRSVDVHVKHTLARPRVATALQRISSLFALTPLLPPIISEADTPDLKGALAALRAQHEQLNPKSQYQSQPGSGSLSTLTFQQDEPHRAQRISPAPPVPEEGEGSVTESDNDDDVVVVSSGGGHRAPVRETLGSDAKRSPASHPPSSRSPPHHQQATNVRSASTANPNADSDSDLPQPKRLKAQPATTSARRSNPNSGSDSDSDAGAGAGAGRSQGSADGRSVPPPPVRGVRQPIRRGGRRF
ncbi:hypothetical protein M0805_000563 [Coniferiporia weirii]|nr:hypothetical protein M0805_000563 [Coniferiporia weirii]